MENVSSDIKETANQDKGGGLKYVGYAGLTAIGVVLGLVGATILSGGAILSSPGSSESQTIVDIVEEAPILYSAQETDKVLITVQGSSTVTSETDKVTIYGTVKSFGLTSEESLENANITYSALNAYLTKQNNTQAQLENISVVPEYQQVENSRTAESADVVEPGEVTAVVPTNPDEVPATPTQVTPYGYTTLQSFTVELETSAAVKALTGMVKVSPQIEINYTTQGVSDTSGTNAMSLELAVKDAENKANAYATMLGIEIVKVQSVTEKTSQSGPPVLYSESSANDFTPKTVDSYYSVEVVFVGESK